MALYDAAILATACEFTDAVNISVLLVFKGSTSGSFAMNDSDISMVVNLDNATTMFG